MTAQNLNTNIGPAAHPCRWKRGHGFYLAGSASIYYTRNTKSHARNVYVGVSDNRRVILYHSRLEKLIFGFGKYRGPKACLTLSIDLI